MLLGWQLVPAWYKGRRKQRQKSNSQHGARKDEEEVEEEELEEKEVEEEGVEEEEVEEGD